MGRYNKLARPVRNDSEAVRIQFKLKLLQLLDVVRNYSNLTH
jgi:hypothetical protein